MMTVASTTIWLGHVPKSAAENDLSDIFGEFGVVKSIDVSEEFHSLCIFVNFVFVCLSYYLLYFR